MNITLHKQFVRGTLAAIPSKSIAHRLLICAALCQSPTEIECAGSSADIEATLNCLRALGAKIEKDGHRLYVQPCPFNHEPVLCDCGESGSTLRFLLPVFCALGRPGAITMHGRLPQRPITPLAHALARHGCLLKPPTIENDEKTGTDAADMGESSAQNHTADGRGLSQIKKGSDTQEDSPALWPCGPGGQADTLYVSGQLTAGVFEIPGDVSSQYISGLLFALPLLKADSEIHITGPLQSASYVRMTIAALEQFGIEVRWREDVIKIKGRQRYRSPGRAAVAGDWSNAAFMLCAGALGGEVTLTGLTDRLQGDCKITEILARLGARVEQSAHSVTVSRRPLFGIEIDAADIPDLVPVLAVTAAGAAGTTVIHHIERLRLKESDRAAATTELIRTLGGQIQTAQNRMIITGTGRLHGGTIDSHADHRMVMSAAVASLLCDEPVTIAGAQAVEKSYPHFFEDFSKL